MHQPVYRDSDSGQYILPWTYLHAIKDYVDMAAHLEANADARAVVNFAPVLLEQIEDYARQLRAFLDAGEDIGDPLLLALGSARLPHDTPARLALAQACLRANEEHLINRFSTYRELADITRSCSERPALGQYLNDQFLIDLLTWYHIAWLGESVHRHDPRVQALIKKAARFEDADRRILLEVITGLMEGVIGRYAALAAAGQIELAVSPYAHPIIPLMLDFKTARESLPDSGLPEARAYPGGVERASWHLQRGIEVFERCFGFRPAGCWPSEGGVSDATLRLLGEAGFRWAASGGAVLANSQAAAAGKGAKPVADDWCHRPAVVPGSEVRCFFRDDGLSDLIGFTYAKWHADDAVADMVKHLETIAAAVSDPGQCVVSIILDGENAWEYYPENGCYFLDALYRELGDHPGLRLTTFSEYLDAGRGPLKLPGLVSGSWVYGTFSTWIGHDDKNRAWDLLVEARLAFEETVAGGGLAGERLREAENQLAVCEGSDWFWWFGDDNPPDTVRDFDRLYRRHLAGLYRLLGRPEPAHLADSISAGGGAPAAGGVMRVSRSP